MLPLSPERAERQGFEYYRHRTLSPFAVFNTKSRKVLGKTVTRRTRAQFVASVTDLVADQPKGREIHVICDNVSVDKTRAARDFLPNILTSIITIPRPSPLRLTRSSGGSSESGATLLHAAFSPPR